MGASSSAPSPARKANAMVDSWLAHELRLVLFVSAGGALGTAARFLLASVMHDRVASGLPLGTLAVNLVGSFCIGLLAHLGTSAHLLNPTLALALTTGLMGGFTTYSAFSLETIRAIEAGHLSRALLYVALTTLGALLACALGLFVARSLVGAR